MNYFLLTFLSLASVVHAQQGDRKDVILTPVVPKERIPQALVLDAQQALQSFQIAPGFVIEAIAAEPLIEKPVALDIDPAGRLWICEMVGFMPDLDGNGEATPQGRIVILEDSNGDGRMDQRTVFLDKVLLPRAVNVQPDGILFIDQDELRWIKRDGLKPVGTAEIVQKGLIEAGNPEHKANGLLNNLDNWIYNAKSNKRLRRIEGKWVIADTTARGQWGITRDDYGRLYSNNNSCFLIGEALEPNLLRGNSGVNFKIAEGKQLGPNNTWPIRVTPGVNRAYQAKQNGYPDDTLDPQTYKLRYTTAACGPLLYRGTNFPSEWYGRVFSPDPSVNLVKAIDVQEKDGVLSGSHPLGGNEFLASTDERFRPDNVYNAPDGSMLLLDMYHGIIQHKTYLTSYLREQYASRGLDKPATGTGRIYRIRSTSGKLEPRVNFEVMATADVVPYLGHANGWHRDTAQRVLVSRNDAAVVSQLEELAGESTKPIAQINALWTLEGLHQLTAKPIALALRSNDSKVVSSTLWASTTLNDAERAKLSHLLVSLQPSTKESRIHLVRALGPLGTQTALDRIAELLQQDPGNRTLQAAAVAGLDKHEQEFASRLTGKFDDAKLKEWLTAASAGPTAANASSKNLPPDHLASFERGKKWFAGEAACFGCHGANGEGVTSLGPPLDGSEWVTGSPERLIKILLHGLSGPVEVAGIKYTPSADMPGLSQNPMMDDSKLADIATYIRHEWGNRAGQLKPEVVAKVRDETKARGAKPYTAKELGQDN